MLKRVPSELAVLGTALIFASVLASLVVSKLASRQNVIPSIPVRLSVEPSALLGHPPDKGRWALVEFMDYQCPPCKATAPQVDALVALYRDRITVRPRHFPLSFHKDARGAAVFAESARALGRFPEVHKALLLERSVDAKSLVALAKKLNLPPNKLRDSESASAELVKGDEALAAALGVDGTPAFFLVSPTGAVYKLASLQNVGALLQEESK